MIDNSKINKIVSKVLKEYFPAVVSSDIHDYNFGDVKDFLGKAYQKNSFDWVITNPPFRLAEEFLMEANFPRGSQWSRGD